MLCKIINTLPGLKQKASCLKTWDPRPVSLPLQGPGSQSGGCKSSPPLAYQAAGLVVPRSGGLWEGPVFTSGWQWARLRKIL